MINYSLIFEDMLRQKGLPVNEAQLKAVASTGKNIDVLKVNESLLDKSTTKEDARLRSYTEMDIHYILQYKKENHLNITQTATHFKMSRNTLAKWIRLYTNSAHPQKKTT